MGGIGIERVHPVQDGGGVAEFARAIVEAALAAAHHEVEAHRGAAQPVEHVEKVIDQRIVHGPAELRMRMQHQRHGARRSAFAADSVLRCGPPSRAE